MQLDNKNPQQDIGQKNPYPSEGIDKKFHNKLESEISNYRTLISSSPPPKQDKIEEQLGKVANGMKEELGIPDATISLKRKSNNGIETVTGTISIPGKPTNVSLSVCIDSPDGSIVIGKPIDGKTTIASFNLGVRLEGSKVKENFEKINNALRILPHGFSAVGFTDKGDVVAYNDVSNGISSPGTKERVNFCVVSVDDKGRPLKITPTEVEVKHNNNVSRLCIEINNEVSFVEPFPASINQRNAQKLKSADDFFRRAASGLLGGGDEKGIIEKGILSGG